MQQKPIVSTKLGKVCGIRQRSNFSGTNYYSFYGIPYGQPPENDLRFKDPVKAKPWKSTRDATTPREGCIQYSLKVFDIIGTEDCLYLNIYTPELPEQNKPLKPVIVCIHPGGYQWGSPDPSHHGSPNYVMHCDVVYVTIGYRLHILGFLNLGLEECSGNQALKDIVLALEWIQENIHAFNGDPKNVTLLGSSSGAAVIQYLMLSPRTTGLFHKCILMSGYAFNCLALERETDVAEHAFKFAQLLGFRGTNERKLLAFLRTLQPKQFIQQLRYFVKNSNLRAAMAFPCGSFGPSVDTGKNAILPKSPRKLVSSIKRIPIMVGICEQEAVLGFVNNFRDSTEKHMKTSYQQNCWGWAHGLSEEETESTYELIKSFYMKDYNPDEVPLQVKVDILTDAAYSDLYDTLIDVISADLPSAAYVYKFQYDGELAEVKPKVQKLIDGRLSGTYHADDIGYWSAMNEPVAQETKQFVRMFTKLISNFARTADPTCEGMPIQWRPSTPDDPCYMEITNNLNLVEGRLNGERFEFWRDLKRRLNRDKLPEPDE